MSTAAMLRFPPVFTHVHTAALDAPGAVLRTAPFAFLAAPGVLGGEERERLCADFPDYREAGFFTHDPARCGPSINALVDEIRSPEFAWWIGAKLGLPDLPAKPMLVHLGSLQNRRHGTIHTDSTATLATVLFYFNRDWPHGSAGCLRLLTRGDDIQSLLVPEIPPLYGTMVAFRRSECSFHGYLPYEGERRVLKAAWLTSQAEYDRKQARNRSVHLVKRILGPLDRWFDRKRADSKSHGL